MNGVSSDMPALYCTGIGLLPWKAPTGETLLLKCYYSVQAAEMIISPTDVVNTAYTDFSAWTQHSDIDSGKGYIQFHRRTGSTLTYPLRTDNGLWYTDNHGCAMADYQNTATTPTVRKLTNAALCELMHQCLGHPGECIMKTIPHHMEDISPLKGNSFYKCASCLHGKMRQRAHTSQSATYTVSNTEEGSHNDIQCGQHFQMDYGFMKGTGFCNKDGDGKTITSIDGYRAYCLIIDRKSRYTWIFLTKTKNPPIQIITSFTRTWEPKPHP